MANRTEQLRALFAGAEIDCLVVMRPENRVYLSGFTGSSGWLAITAEAAYLLTDFRYTEQAGAEAPDFTIVRHGRLIADTLREILARAKVTRVGFEADYTTFQTATGLREKLDFAELIPTTGLVERLRLIKDAAEVRRLRQAVRIGDAAFAHILGVLRPGLTETEVALELEFFMRRQGASGNSFDPIVASGPRASLPHAQPTGRVLGAGEGVKMDFGCVYEGYCSDLTRTVFLGSVSDKQKEIYDIVLQAQLAALAAIKPGVTGAEVDAVARNLIAESGYGDNFGHGLGHGVGLYIHEDPRLSPGYEGRLEPGMVVTVEPGIYLPGWGGVRIEDMVLVNENGCENLTEAPKALTIV